MSTVQTTREKILAVAADLFARKGYAGTSTRDIASVLSIASPSLYHHFRSKGAILTELLKEPLAYLEGVVREAMDLSGRDRARKILDGLLRTLEFHNGIVVLAAAHGEEISDSFRDLASARELSFLDILGQDLEPESRSLRIVMAVGAVQGVVKEITNTTRDSGDFVHQLRSRREAVIAIVMKILFD